MTTLILLQSGRATVGAPLPTGAFRATSTAPPTPNAAVLNAGQGDGRDKIRPNIKLADAPSVTLSERGQLLTLTQITSGERIKPGEGAILMPADDPATLQPFFADLAMIAIEFPRAVDGRGFSNARLLRQRLHWAGELRAVGDVLIDQLFYMARCGFDSFALRGDQDVPTAIAAFSSFPDVYQDAADASHPFILKYGEQ